MQHLIPQSWSHVHILISVFPTVGLVFILGFYIAGFSTNNDAMRRTCLVFFFLLALLSVPIYMSAVGSQADLAANPRFSKDMIATHALWGMVDLGLLALTGLAALIELLRSWGGHRPSRDPFHLVLGLAVATLFVSGVADELGFVINHNELQLSVTIPDISTPQVWSHVHMMLNHVPTAGFVFAFGFFVIAILANNEGMKRGSLIAFTICCIAGVPTYVAGTAAMWALTQPTIPEISKAVINAHRDMALLSLIGLAFTGTAAWIELWRSRALGRISGFSLSLVFILAVVTLGLMTETGHRGGLINHPEIRTVTETLPTDATAGISEQLETTMKEMIWFVPWQTVHFFGYCLIFGAVFFVVMRVLGFWKSISYAATHRVLLLGFLGVLMNIVSGMLMMFSDSYRYVVNDTTFAPKIIFLTIGAIAVLYFSVSNRLWNVKAGESAPRGAKWVAVIVLLAWAGVIVCGRLLPYL